MPTMHTPSDGVLAAYVQAWLGDGGPHWWVMTEQEGREGPLVTAHPSRGRDLGRLLALRERLDSCTQAIAQHSGGGKGWCDAPFRAACA